ncbi:general substrate transporter [Crepidotus variabilis]|uniref:General substrate transporter n=1 Tax=Crepidotus variabilis TaxID=179855 RepID=A0A9P6E4H9_9AGAR|nr:general substrate transporter [Crepidotus variabilis]
MDEKDRSPSPTTKHHGGGLVATADLNQIEAPVTWKAYLMCAFATFGGIFFGYDSGYINGVSGSKLFIEAVEGPGKTALSSPHSSLIVSILSSGTFFGALMAGDLADYFGRRTTVIVGCFTYLAGVVVQVSTTIDNPTTALGLIVAGRLLAGFGVGIVSATIIMYMSEICPRKVRGALVSGYQFCITIGLLLASVVVYATKDRQDTGQYRVPIGVQFAWGIILATGLFFLPESPRYYVKRGNIERARASLSSLRGQPGNSHYIEAELSEIVANAELEKKLVYNRGYIGTWANCFSGSLWQAKSNLRRTILGTSLQMMQQWTGVNFIFYYSTPFLKSTHAIENTFLISLIFTLVNVCSTPISFWSIERFGRRPLLIWGAFGMLVCQFIVGIVGVTVGFDHATGTGDNAVANNLSAVNAQIAFIAIFIFFFASTWGPGAWVVIGEVFPLTMRSRGVALSTASNWLWNTIIAVITPYMVGEDQGNLKSKVFFVWGGLCTCAFVYAYFLVPETKGLTLEQVDQMFEESTPRTSSRWRPTQTFASQMGGKEGHLDPTVIEDVRHGV